MSALEHTEPPPDHREHARAWMPAFLEALSLIPNVVDAARHASISQSTVYWWRANDADFAEAWAEAKESGVSLLERIAHTRATTGDAKRVVRRTTKTVDGKEVEVVETVEEQQVVSNALLIFLLKAHKPETYRERVDHRHTGGDGQGPIQLEVYREPTHERMLELARLARELEDEGRLPNGVPAVIEAGPDG